MLAKLLPAILDKLDIFIMEIEELYVPKVCGEVLTIISCNLIVSNLGVFYVSA